MHIKKINNELSTFQFFASLLIFSFKKNLLTSKLVASLKAQASGDMKYDFLFSYFPAYDTVCPQQSNLRCLLVHSEAKS